MQRPSCIAIDLKSFYASVECVERGLDPMDANLVVADLSRTEKTICLAVSPALKAHGIPGRARLFEIIERVRDINAARLRRAPAGGFTGKAYLASELQTNAALALDYVVARPRMAHYMQYSTRIYQIYLKYLKPEEIHVYSIDEVFIDAERYLSVSGLTAREFAMEMILDVLHSTGITATAGIGTNLYLCKIAMDIQAKHSAPDENGVRIAELDELSYRRLLWTHRPLTDFWRVGRGYARKLESNGMMTMGDVARCSLGRPDEAWNEDLLYDLFGVHAELLIDHAWGWESCTIADIKTYRPEENSLSSGQVLSCPYDFEAAKLIAREMADQLALQLVERRLVTDQLVLSVGYDRADAAEAEETTQDYYGRRTPRPVHGSFRLKRRTSSTRLITEAVLEIFEQTVDRRLKVRRLSLSAEHVLPEAAAEAMSDAPVQLDMFTDYAAEEPGQSEEEAALEREKARQQAVLDIKRRFGKNAILKGMNLKDGATAKDRNGQIGGHRA